MEEGGGRWNVEECGRWKISWLVRFHHLEGGRLWKVEDGGRWKMKEGGGRLLLL